MEVALVSITSIKMEVLTCVVIITNFISAGVKAEVPELKPEIIQNSTASCNKFAKNPYFEIELVIGKPWRVYHTWNMKIDTKCLDIVFKNATPAIIHRIWSDMYDYMEQQPYWDSAALLLISGAARQELLLFPAQGVAGGFDVVPNVIRSGDIPPLRNGVPLLKFQLKLVRNGKFLVMMDCHVGITSLAARAAHPPYRSEVAAAVAELDLGDGFPACTLEKSKNDQLYIK